VCALIQYTELGTTKIGIDFCVNEFLNDLVGLLSCLRKALIWVSTYTDDAVPALRWENGIKKVE
jgi:hypothetical protein